MNVPGAPRLMQRERQLGQQIERPEQARLDADHPLMALDLAVAGREIEMHMPAGIEHDAEEIEQQQPAP
jgi:hypothetical protein